MADDRDHHVTIFVPPDAARAIEAARREWDPVMAARIAAHVTVFYPREAPAVELLVERAREACAAIPPFRPHVTIVHPRTSRRGRDVWDTGQYRRHDREFLVEEAALTAFDGDRWTALVQFALGRSH